MGWRDGWSGYRRRAVSGVVALAAAATMAGCCTVSAPPGGNAEQEAYAEELAGRLEFMRGRQLAGAYQTAVEESFDRLGDREMAMHLWLRVVECESQRGSIALARAMYQYALDTYRVRGGDPELLLIESRSDARDRSPELSAQWLTTLRAIH